MAEESKAGTELVPRYNEPISFDAWVEANKAFLKPPVGNKLMFGAGQQKVMVIGGPNQRKDFHLDLGEELFWQLKGDMVLEVVEKGVHKAIPIREGEVFLLPPAIPHSPQRPADTVGLVFERERKADEQDAMRWYVDDTTELLYQEVFHCFDLGTQLPPVMAKFKASEESSTGVPSGAPIPALPYDVDEATELPPAFNFAEWVAANAADRNAYAVGGPDSSSEYSLFVVTQGLEWTEFQHDAGEVWLRVLEGSLDLTVRVDSTETTHAMKPDECLLLPVGAVYKGVWSKGLGVVVKNKVVA